MLKTTNGGTNWNIYQVNTTNNIYRIFFSNASTGYATSGFSQSLAGSFGNIYKTTNGGINWTSPYPSNFILPNTLALLNTDSIFISSSSMMKGGSHSALYRSFNGGNNFTTCQFQPKEASLAQITSKNSLWWRVTLYSPTLYYKLIKSTDLGNTWSNIAVDGDTMTVGNFFFVNDNVGFALKSNGIYKTNNSGLNWIFNSVPPSNISQFLNENTGWTTSLSSGTMRIYKTTNSCLSWEQGLVTVMGFNTLSFRLFFADENTGWIAGRAQGGKGFIMKSTTGGLTYVNSPSTEVPNNFSLSQNYPNPFNPSTRINYELPITNYVSIKVYDVLGNEIETLVNEKQNAGSYSVNFNAASLPSGIYFYKLVTEIFSETKKMILKK